MENKAFTKAEIKQFRAETKGTAARIHFNNAGASLPPDVVLNSIIAYLKEEAVNGGYETEAKYGQELSDTYTSIAKLINAGAGEIAILENASIAWSLAFNGITWNKGDIIITSEMEYVTNVIGFIDVQKKYGVTIKVIPNYENGNFAMAEFKAAITPQVKLIAITHIASAGGGMMPIVEIGKIASSNNILYLVDACQSVGQVPVDVKEINCDMLSVTGRKYLRAPRGTGFLFVRKEVQDKLKPIFIDGSTVKSISKNNYELRDDAKRFECYEKNRALTMGLGKAVEYTLNIGVARIWLRIQYLAGTLRTQLRQINGVTVHDSGDQQCGIVTFSVKGTDCMVVQTVLAAKNINVSVGLAKSTIYYMNKKHLTSVVRASVHYYNTLGEINLLCDTLKSITV